MNITTMQDKVIEKFGFEHNATICFFELCEVGTDEEISKLYNKIMGVN